MKPLTAFLGSLLICLAGIVHAQDNPLLNYLPVKTNMVITFNPLRLAQKVPGDAFRQSFIYRELMKDPGSTVSRIFGDITKTGISFSQDLFIITSEGKSPGIKRTHLLGLLQDREMFEALIRDIAPQAEIKTYGTDRVMMMGGNVLAWNNRVFIMGNIKGEEYGDMPFFTDSVTVSADTTLDTDTQPYFDTAAYSKWLRESVEKKEKNLREFSFEMLAPKTGNPLSTHEKFRSLLTMPGDLHIWNEDNAASPGNMILPMQHLFSRMASLVSGTRTAVVSFDNGKILLTGINYPNPGMASLMEKHPPSAVGDELLKHIPKGNLLALVNSTYSPALANEILSLEPFREFTDSLKKMVSFDMTKLPAVFGNQLMAAVVQTDEASNKMGVEVIVALPIANFIEFKKMGQQLLTLYDSLKRTDSSSKFFREFKPVIRHDEKLMVFSLSGKAAAGFLDHSLTQPAPEWTRAYTQYPVFMHINLKEILKMAITRSGTKETGEQEQWMIDQFDQVLVYGGRFENGATRTTTEIRFADANLNSLAQLFGMINRFGEQMTRKTEMMDEEMDMPMDSTVVMDTVQKDQELPLEVPRFSDPDVQEFADDYAEFLTEYRTGMNNPEKLQALSSRMSGWSERALSISEKLAANKNDKKTWDAWIIEVSNYLRESGETDIPPPPPQFIPPQVEMKKAPVKKGQ